jgi:hypothetical protein
MTLDFLRRLLGKETEQDRMISKWLETHRGNCAGCHICPARIDGLCAICHEATL